MDIQAHIDAIIRKTFADYDSRAKANDSSRSLPSDLEAILKGVVSKEPPEVAGKVFPDFYHQKDSSGSTMVELLAKRDAAKSKAQRNEARTLIQNWTLEHDAQRKSPNQKNRSLSEDLQAITRTQDGISSGGSAPSQPALSSEVSLAPELTAEQLNSLKSAARAQKTGVEPSKTSTLVDSAQLGLDAVGVADPTPFTDGLNAAISLGRAFITDPERRNEHLQNAAISTVSMIPYLGDTAKLLKGGRAAKTVSRTGDMLTTAEKQQARAELRSGTETVLGATDSGGGSPPGAPPNSPPGSDEPEEKKGSQRWSDVMASGVEKAASFAGEVGKAGAKIASLVKGLELLNTGVLILNRDLAQYNGKIASSYAQSDVRTMQREIGRGKQLEGPLSSLNESQSELKDNISKVTTPVYALGIQIIDLLTKITNVALALVGPLLRVISLITTALGKIVESIEFVVWALGKFLELLHIKKPVDPANSDWRTFLHDVSDGKFDGRKPEFGTNNRVHSKQILPNQDHKDVFGP